MHSATLGAKLEQIIKLVRFRSIGLGTALSSDGAATAQVVQCGNSDAGEREGGIKGRTGNEWGEMG